MKKTLTALTAGIAALGLAVPMTASADSAWRGDDFNFTYDLAKTTTIEGAKAEYTRLRREVRSFCERRGVPGVRGHGDESECQAYVMKKAAAQMPQPLQALHYGG
jgi:UrcA family protein